MIIMNIHHYVNIEGDDHDHYDTVNIEDDHYIQ